MAHNTATPQKIGQAAIGPVEPLSKYSEHRGGQQSRLSLRERGVLSRSERRHSLAKNISS